MKLNILFILVAASFGRTFDAVAQSQDSLRNTMVFSGSVGMTTNGFSIIPSFSLNSPALVSILSWRRNRFSVSPDVRLTPDLRKGGAILWFRYQLVEKKKFTFRMGAHPGFNFQLRDITSNGNSSTISQMRRFLAWEMAPNLILKKNWTMGLYYMQGNGLQLDGPRTIHFLTVNTLVSKIPLTGKLKLNIYGAAYHLFLDGYKGRYITGTLALTHPRSPISLESSFNKTIDADLPGNQDFLWNLSLNYNFRKTFYKMN